MYENKNKQKILDFKPNENIISMVALETLQSKSARWENPILRNNGNQELECSPCRYVLWTKK